MHPTPTPTPKKMDKTIKAAMIGAFAVIIAALLPILCTKSSGPDPHPKPRYLFSGAVVNATTNNSIGGAEISIVGRNQHYYSEGNGNFHLNLDTNEIRVRVTASGYQPFDESFSLPQEGSIIPLTKVP